MASELAEFELRAVSIPSMDKTPPLVCGHLACELKGVYFVPRYVP